MKKSLKILAYTVSGMIIFAIILPILASIILQINAVQNFAVKKASQYLSQIAGTEISIGRVDIEFFTKAVLSDVLMRDHVGDTMIYAKNVNVDINGINFITGKIALGTVALDAGQVNLYRDSLGVMNISAAFANFKSKNPTPNSGNFKLSALELDVTNTSFSIRFHEAKKNSYGVNWQDFKFFPINIKASNISVLNYNIWLSLDQLKLTEKSGWRVNNLSSQRCGVDSSGMYFAKVKLQTNGTKMELDSMNFLTKNRSWWDWNNFENKMIMSAKVKRSTIDSRTLAYLIGKQIKRHFSFDINKASLFGPLSHMQGRVDHANFDKTWVDLNYSIIGLPRIDSTRFEVQLDDLNTTSADVERVYSVATGGELVAGLDILRRCGSLTARGSFSGLLNNFQSNITLNGSLAGSIIASLHLNPNQDGGITMAGSVSTEQLEAGNILDIKNLGRASMNGTMLATLGGGKALNLSTKGTIRSLEYGTYRFNSINVNGDILPAGFQGSVTCSDSNLMFNANGVFDVSGAQPKYDFDLNLEHADLAITGLNKRDSISVLSARANIRGVGKTIDDMNGYGIIRDIIYISPTDTVRTGAIHMESHNTSELKEIKIVSDFADLELRGRNSFSEIFRYFSQSLQRFLPSFPEATHIVTGEKQAKSKINKRKDVTFADGYYQLTINVKDANNVAGIFIPGLEVADGSNLNFFFNPYLDQFSLRATSHYIATRSMYVENMELDSRNHTDSLSLFLTADNLMAAGVNMPNFSLIGGIRNNIITLGGRFVDKINHTNILLRTTTTFLRAKNGMSQMNIALHPTPLIVNSNPWTLSPATILVDTSGIEIHNFALNFANQSLDIDGRLGRNETDTISVKVNSFDISPASSFISSLGYKIRGTTYGDIRLVSAFGIPKLFAAIDFKDAFLNDFSLGNPKLRSTFDRENTNIKFALGENLLSPPIQGFYSLKSKQWGGDIKFENFDLKMLEPMLSGILTSTTGRANVDLQLRGKGSLPSLSGKVDIKNYTATVDYTKATYSLKGMVDVTDNRFTLSSTPFQDNTGGKGLISAFFDSDHFQDLTFGVDATFTDLLALNTTLKENTSFYGKAWGTGHLSINGVQNKTNIEIVAQTAGSSQFNLPLSTASTIESADFIRFINPKADSLRAQQVKKDRRSNATKSRMTNASELDIKIDLGVLPNTQALIEFDSKIGDVIKGRGEGNLSMHINPTQNLFNMTGSVEISQGDYLFTLLTIFQRHFTINPGATITWTGDAANPLINMSASYKVKTSLSNISQTETMGQKTTANIDCSILLSGSMQSPDISFNITAPSADPETQNLIRNSINTQEALSMQFLSLILSNSFMPDMGTSGIGTMGGSFAGVTGLEFLSNQLSQMISSEKVNIRIGYRMQTTSSAEEYSAGVGADLIQDVLSLEVDGNYTNGASNSSNPFTMDVDLVWNINKKKTLQLKGFSRTIDRFDETQGQQESGVGIYFRQDFNNLKDLKKRLKKSFEKK